MDNINEIFRESISSLLSFAETVCTNNLSRNVAFIKCYGHKENRIQYELDCFRNRHFFSEQEIMNELNFFCQAGRRIGLIDLSLIYSFPDETIVAVDLLFTEEDKPVGAHFSVRRTRKNLELNKINLNDYVDELIYHPS